MGRASSKHGRNGIPKIIGKSGENRPVGSIWRERKDIFQCFLKNMKGCGTM
jgi:hypothetical protein